MKKLINKEKINSLRFLIFVRLIAYLVIIGLTFALFNYTLSNFTYKRLNTNFINKLHIDGYNYKQVDESKLIKNNISLEVIDSHLNVIYSKGYNTGEVKKYTPKEFAITIYDDDLEFNVIADSVITDNGEELTIIYKQYLTNKVLQKMGKDIFQYIFAMVIGSLLLLILSYILLTRNIYRKIKKEFDFIQDNISKTPYDRSKLDLSSIPLLETREVSKSYNDMLDEMDKIRKEKDRLVKKNNRLISNLSHDLKSPITSLTGYWDILTTGNIEGDELNKYCGYITNSINDLNQLSTMLFEQLKYQFSEYKLNFKDEDLNSFLRNICANYYTLYISKGFDMEVDISEESFIAKFDAVHMKRVFTNILDNCLKHNAPTQLTVSTAEINNNLFIYFKDNGVGIPHGDWDQIFDAFYQGDESRTYNNGGLGLYIVKQILLKHGGNIRIIDEPEYSTVFELRFPKS